MHVRHVFPMAFLLIWAACGYAAPTAPVLLLDGDTTPENAARWQAAWQTLGIAAEVRAFTSDTPLGDLSPYPVVLLATGHASRPVLSPAQEQQLMQFSLDGGYLVVESANYFTARGGTVAGLPSAVMGLAGVDARGATWTHLTGVGDWQDLGTLTLAADADTGSHDILLPERGTDTVLIDPETGAVAATAAPGGFYLGLPARDFHTDDLDPVTVLAAAIWKRGAPRQAFDPDQPALNLPLDPRRLTDRAVLRLINPHADSVEVTVHALTDAGRAVAHQTLTLAPGVCLDLDAETLTPGRYLKAARLHVAGDPLPVVVLSGEGAAGHFILPAPSAPAATLPIPHIAVDTGVFRTFIGLAHTADGFVQTRLHTPDAASRPLPLSVPGHTELIEAADLFGAGIEGRYSHAEIRALDGAVPAPVLVGVEVFGTLNPPRLAGLTLNGASAETLVFSHITPTGSGFWTGLAVVNPGADPAAVHLSAYDDQGLRVAEADTVLPAQGKLLGVRSDTAALQAFFPQGLPEQATWLALTADAPITGFTLFGETSGRHFSGLSPSLACTDGILAFAGDAARYAGVALVNPHGTAQTVTLILAGADGRARAQLQQRLPPHGRILFDTTARWPSVAEHDGDYLRVRAPLGVHGLLVTGDREVTYLSALELLPVP